MTAKARKFKFALLAFLTTAVPKFSLEQFKAWLVDFRLQSQPGADACRPIAVAICDTLVFGCGDDRGRASRPAIGDVTERLADFTWVTSDNLRTGTSNCKLPAGGYTPPAAACPFACLRIKI
jgi:hypothetical protein